MISGVHASKSDSTNEIRKQKKGRKIQKKKKKQLASNRRKKKHDPLLIFISTKSLLSCLRPKQSCFDFPTPKTYISRGSETQIRKT